MPTAIATGPVAARSRARRQPPRGQRPGRGPRRRARLRRGRRTNACLAARDPCRQRRPCRRGASTHRRDRTEPAADGRDPGRLDSPPQDLGTAAQADDGFEADRLERIDQGWHAQGSQPRLDPGARHRPVGDRATPARRRTTRATASTAGAAPAATTSTCSVTPTASSSRSTTRTSGAGSARA